MRTAKYYPKMPPMLPGETGDEYTDRLTGADKTGRVPYNHVRNRQCAIGYHEQCSERALLFVGNPRDRRCKCPCHDRLTPRRGHRR